MMQHYYLEEFDDVLYVCEFVRWKSALCKTLELYKPQFYILRRVLFVQVIFNLTQWRGLR